MSALVVLCQYEDESRVSALADKCVAEGLQVVLAPSLYDIPESSSLWESLARLGSISAIWSALHPRPATWLLHRHGLSAPVFRYEAYGSVDACFEAMALFTDEENGHVRQMPTETGVPPEPRWYPVVDKDRCDDCGQCLQFCLFGVYTRDEANHVLTSNPDACKTGCPACSRICPKGAIMFPLYVQDPAISGTPGLFMSPDKSARRMFYIRTKKACPVCKIVPSGPAQSQGETCPECGSAYVQPKSPIQDDIDALIDALDAQP